MIDSRVSTYCIRYPNGTEFKGLSYGETLAIYNREFEAGIPCDIHPEITAPWGTT